MNRADLINWLTTYTPIESDLRRYYKINYRPISEREFYNLFQSAGGTDSIIGPKEFHNLDAAVLPQSDKIQPLFSDTLWMDTAQDISVRKHPRYLPEIQHSHMFVEMAYVFQGTCTQTFYVHDQDSGERIDMKEGMLCIITPGVEHTISVFDDSVVINILIRTDTLKRTLTELVVGDHALFYFFQNTLYGNGSHNFMVFDTNQDEAIRDTIVAIMLELCEEKRYSQKTSMLMLGLLFTYLQRDHSNSIRFSEYAPAGIGYIPQVISYMNYNYRTATVENIAEHFHLSRPYLSRIFKAHTNTTIIQALQRIRLERASELLIRTQMSVHDISEAVGYGDITFFIRVFRKTYQETPLQYRKNHVIL